MDTFSKLPGELHSLILAYLDVMDIINLLDTYAPLFSALTFVLASRVESNGDILLHCILHKGRPDIALQILCSLQPPCLTESWWRELLTLKTSRGKNLLHLAVKCGCKELVEYILHSGIVDVHGEDNHFLTPLAEAIKAENIGIARLLLGEDVDPNLGVRRRPLCMAAAKELGDFVHLLLDSGADVNAADESGRTPLLHAVLEQHASIVILLLGRPGVNTRSKDRRGRSALSYAVSKDRFLIVKLLLNQDKGTANVRDDDGRLPLHWAVTKQMRATVSLLLDIPSLAVNARRHNGDTALHEAIKKEDIETAQLLLNREDIRINDWGSQNRTPLAWAASTGNVQIVRLLLDRSDIIEDTSVSPETALEVAIKERVPAVIPLLIQRHSPSLRIFVAALWANNERLLRWCTKGTSMDPNSRIKPPSPFEGPIIHAAASYGSTTAMRSLLSREGLVVDATDQEQRTALHIACQFGRDNIVKMLLESTNIDVNARTIDGETALHLAIDGRCDHGLSAEIVSLLLTRDDIQPNLRDNRKRTPICVAVNTKSYGAAQLLLDRQDINLDGTGEHGLEVLYFASKQGDVNAVGRILVFETVKHYFALDVGQELAASLLAEGPDAVMRFLSS